MIGKFLIIVAMLVFLMIAITDMNTRFISETSTYGADASAALNQLRSINSSTVARSLLNTTTKSVSKTTVGGVPVANPFLDPIGGFQTVLTMFIEIPTVIIGFGSDVGRILKLDPVFIGSGNDNVGLLGTIVYILLIAGILLVLFKVNIFGTR